ncbi:MAG: PDZ domain-containing protein, partial [Polyangiales bacterium]
MRAALSIVLSLAALGFSVAVVLAAWSAPYKGFVAFTGQRIVEVDAGGPADRAGLEPGDRLVAIDGEPIHSILGYAQRMLSRAPGERVRVTVETADGAQRTATLTLQSSGPPIGALAASVLAAVLLGLGLVARIGRPGDVAAVRFWRTAVVYAVACAAVLSWSHLVIHPGLALAGLAAAFFGGPVTSDFVTTFPARPRRSMRGWRIAVWVTAAVLLGASLACIAWTVQDHRAGRSGDEAARWAVRFVTAGLGLLVPMGIGGVIYQYRNLRRAGQPTVPGQRAQLEWLLFGIVLASIPALVAVPFAAADIDWFLLRGYRPFAGAMAVLWLAGAALAVLRVRLADVDLVIGRSVAYALASATAVVIYFAVAVVVGLGAERLLGRSHVVTPVVAALVAAALFGPIRTRVSGWIDRRVFRDRVHYVESLRALSDRVRELREPDDLAREVIDHAADALRASSGALYLDAVDDEGVPVLRREYARGDGYPEKAPVGDPPEPPEGGVRAPIEGAETRGALVLGPRRGGDLYSSQERDLLGALAAQLATAFDNARAFGTIAQMRRTLEQQNREIRGLRDRLEDENRYLRQRLEA